MNNMNNFETVTAHNFETIALAIADRVMDMPGQNLGRSFRDLVQQCQDTLMGEWVDRRSWKKDAGPVDIRGLAELDPALVQGDGLRRLIAHRTPAIYVHDCCDY